MAARTAIPLWPAVTLLMDPSRTLTLEQVQDPTRHFQPHSGTLIYSLAHWFSLRDRIESEASCAMAHTALLTGMRNRINDRHGRDVGDAMLVSVGRHLQSQMRHSHLVARLGGDEFVVLARGLGHDNAAPALSEKMLASFKTPFDALGCRCTVGLTIGYALAPLEGVTSEGLLKLTDQAMYAGKQAGRGRVLRANAQPNAAVAVVA